jgi:hypothetical protein
MIIDVNLFPGNSGFEDDMVYVGSGGLSHRPSPWASPFGCRSCYEILDTSSSPPDDSSFLRYASSRADKITWLAPLIGKRLVCSCNNKNIHIGVLATLIESTFDVIAVPEASPIQTYDFSNSFSKIQHFETTFGLDCLEWNALPMDPQHPCIVPWPDVWQLLVDEVRCGNTLKFWDIFSGTGQLTKAFSEGGWVCGPPIDVCLSKHFNLLNPLFVAVIVGLVLEGRFQIVSMTPPYDCSGSSCNGLLTVCNNLSTACIKSGCDVLFMMPSAAKEWSSSNGTFASLQLTNHALIDTCLFGAPWSSRLRFTSTFTAIGDMSAMCGGGHDTPF